MPSAAARSLKKLPQAIGLMLLLGLLVMLPKYIPLGNETLLEWQRRTIQWNYIGIGANYLLFLVYWGLSGKPLRHFGLQWGQWWRQRGWFLLLTLIPFVLSHGLDYLTTGGLRIAPDGFSTLFFQFVFVAVGEELFWRGIIQTDYGFWTATVGFALIHALNGGDIVTRIVAVLFAGIVGACMGLARKKTDSTWSAVVIHGIVDGFNFIIKGLA